MLLSLGGRPSTLPHCDTLPQVTNHRALVGQSLEASVMPSGALVLITLDQAYWSVHLPPRTLSPQHTHTPTLPLSFLSITMEPRLFLQPTAQVGFPWKEFSNKLVLNNSHIS